jgi:hypothetical protein
MFFFEKKNQETFNCLGPGFIRVRFTLLAGFAATYGRGFALFWA